MVTWAECRDDFVPEGSLRDIYILDGSLAAWNALLNIARACDAGFFIDGEEAPLPEDAAHALTARKSASVLLSLDWQGLVLNAHFFTEEEVELDLDPKEVTDQRSLDNLCSFLAKLSEMTNQEVIVTHQASLRAFLRVSPSGEVVFEPPPAAR